MSCILTDVRATKEDFVAIIKISSRKYLNALHCNFIAPINNNYYESPAITRAFENTCVACIKFANGKKKIPILLIEL